MIGWPVPLIRYGFFVFKVFSRKNASFRHFFMLISVTNFVNICDNRGNPCRQFSRYLRQTKPTLYFLHTLFVNTIFLCNLVTPKHF